MRLLVSILLLVSCFFITPNLALAEVENEHVKWIKNHQLVELGIEEGKTVWLTAQNEFLPYGTELKITKVNVRAYATEDFFHILAVYISVTAVSSKSSNPEVFKYNDDRSINYLDWTKKEFTKDQSTLNQTLLAKAAAKEEALLAEQASQTAKYKELLKNHDIVEGGTIWIGERYPNNIKINRYSKIKINTIAYNKGKQKDTLKINAVYKQNNIDLIYDLPADNDVDNWVYNYFYPKDPLKQYGWSQKVNTAIEEHKIFVGLTKEQAEKSWGMPLKVNKTVGSWGVHEQWVYGDYGPYVYFENGKLTSWQE